MNVPLLLAEAQWLGWQRWWSRPGMADVLDCLKTIDGVKMECAKIMAQLQRPGNKFPAQAMAAAVAQQQEITPLLLDELKRAARQQEEVALEGDTLGYIFAMYLLAQFREPRGLRPLIAFFSTPGDLARRMSGDIITEGLGQLLAMMYARDLSPYKKLVENEQVDSFVRAAALEALLCLVAWQEVEPECVVDYFQLLATEELERQPSHVWNYLAEAAQQCCSDTVWPALATAYDEGLVSELYLARGEVEKAFKRPQAERLTELQLNPGLQPLDDAIAEMESWACFRPKSAAPAIMPTVKPGQPLRKVGRNEPCPCGSGKKYKKCCYLQ